MKHTARRIEGSCHCGNITYVLRWPDADTTIPIRKCGCTFCTKHGGAWTSHSDAALAANITDEPAVSRYKFGHGTAEFHVCSRCGVAPFITSDIEGNIYAVVNVNTFDDVDTSSLERAAVDFDGEDMASRLERRKRNWIPVVSLPNLNK